MSWLTKTVSRLWYGDSNTETDRDGFPLRYDTGATSVTQASVLGLSTAWACTNLVAGTIASLPLMVYRRNAKGVRIPAPDHPLYRILHDSPNADQTALDFWEGLCVGLELRGNGFAYKETTNNRLTGLTPIYGMVAVSRQADGALFYRWTESGRERSAAQDEVFHVRGFGGDPISGMSTLAFGSKTFGLAQDIETSARGTFRNGMRPSAAFTFKDYPKSDELARNAEKRLMESHAGAMNDGRPVFLYGGSEYKPLSINPDDAQLLQSRGFSVDEICRFFGVPPVMIGHGDKTSNWGTGIQEVTLGFVKYALRRRLKRIEQSIAKQLLTPAEVAQGVTVEFNLEGLLRGDSAGRAAFYTASLTNGWMTINEVRSLENLPPVDGGDTPRMQMQNVPITQAGQPPAGVA